MIGLKRGIVKITPHQKQWETAFETEKKNLLKALGNRVVDIQHIGSTSVPGLPAKPIIDISIGLRRFKDARKLLKPMEKAGYGFYKKFQQQILFAKGPDSRRTHYVHVMRYRGAKWTTDMLFRDYLRTHPRRVKAYAMLKLRLAKQFANDRGKYSDGKNRFIKETLQLSKRKL